jgi:dihydroxyacetone kinase-like protein
MVSRDQIVQWLEKVYAVLQENKEYLTKLDAAIGDADHGTNMSRGFTKVMEKLPAVADKDIGSILKTVGMTLISSVGGASGPLYGTFFTRSGMTMAAREELNDEELVNLLQSGVDGIVQRGRAQPGDKTMIDAWLPALDRLKASLAEGKDTVTAMREAVEAARQGMEATVPLQARKGRASYLGERSIGHQDPGATSTYLILKALWETLEN